MMWEIIIGVILAMGILTTVREICIRRTRNNETTSEKELSGDDKTSK